MLDPNLEQALTLAVNEVRGRHHEYLSLEHLLFGIASIAPGRAFLEDAGVDVGVLLRKLEEFFADHITPLGDGTGEVVQTIALQRVMQRIVRRMHSSGRDKAGIGDVGLQLADGFGRQRCRRGNFRARFEEVDAGDFITVALHPQAETGGGDDGLIRLVRAGLHGENLRFGFRRPKFRFAPGRGSGRAHRACLRRY